ncbi:UNVERIFIED_CONTAM: hypothetical protein K2H54_050587 [Gekko kuhli]
MAAHLNLLAAFRFIGVLLRFDSPTLPSLLLARKSDLYLKGIIPTRDFADPDIIPLISKTSQSLLQKLASKEEPPLEEHPVSDNQLQLSLNDVSKLITWDEMSVCQQGVDDPTHLDNSIEDELLKSFEDLTRTAQQKIVDRLEKVKNSLQKSSFLKQYHAKASLIHWRLPTLLH